MISLPSARGPSGAPPEEQQEIDLKIFQVKPTDLDQSTSPDDPCADFSMGGSQLHKFSSPNFPANYPPNLECIRVVNAPKGYDITVDFRGSYFEVSGSKRTQPMRAILKKSDVPRSKPIVGQLSGISDDTGLLLYEMYTFETGKCILR